VPAGREGAGGPGDAGPRRIEVEAARLPGWLDRFAGRHGPVSTDATAEQVVVTAEDGAEARLAVPFPPMAVDHDAVDGGLVAHLAAPRRIGVLLVRKGGYAVGVVEGGALVASKVGSRHVQGRSAAGGWSQQRFARRRQGQAKVALGAAADVAATLLLPEAKRLDAVVTGGDRTSVDGVLDDPRLARLRPLVSAYRIDVPEPRRGVLDATVPRLTAVVVTVTDP
jgi:hypothetical protein